MIARLYCNSLYPCLPVVQSSPGQSGAVPAPSFRSLAGVHSLDAVEAEQRSNTSSVSPNTGLQLHSSPGAGQLSLEEQLKQSLHIGGKGPDAVAVLGQQTNTITQPTLISPHMFSTQPRVHQQTG